MRSTTNETRQFACRFNKEFMSAELDGGPTFHDNELTKIAESTSEYLHVRIAAATELLWRLEELSYAALDDALGGDEKNNDKQ